MAISRFAGVPALVATEFQVSRLIHSIAKAHSCCEEDSCGDRTIRYVSEANIKSLSPSKRSQILEVEQVLARLQNAINEAI